MMALSRSASAEVARRNPIWVAWLWLLLATIGAHATLPVGSPVVPGRGSAFSATTVEVALAPKRQAAASEASAELRLPASDASGSASGADAAGLPPSSFTLSRPWQQPAAALFSLAEAAAASPPTRGFQARAPPSA